MTSAVAVSTNKQDTQDGQGEPAPRSHQDRRERTAELIAKAQKATEFERRALLNEVVVTNLPVARSLAHRYRNRGQTDEELEQVAYLALTKAVHGFKPSRGEDLLVYAVPTILGELKRYFRDAAWTVRPPRRLQELQADLAPAQEALTQELGRAPTAKELAEHLGRSVDEVVEAQDCGGCFTPDSLDQPSVETGQMLSDRVGERDRGFERAEAVALLGPACRRLSWRDRRLLYLRFYEGKTQQQIADEFGVTQVQVSRLLKRIFATIREDITGSAEQPGGHAGRQPAAADSRLRAVS